MSDHEDSDKSIAQQDVSFYGIRLGRLYDRIPPGQYVVFLEKPEPESPVDASVKINRIDQQSEFVLRPYVTEEYPDDKS